MLGRKSSLVNNRAARVQAHRADGDTYIVELASGGSVSVLVKVNLFALSRDDRNLVIDLVDKLKGYVVGWPTTPVERAPSDEESDTVPAG